jgi:hypothetical protein
MSDSQVSENVLERPSQGGQVERANGQQDLGTTDGQPSSGQADNENIRKLQSTYDKKLSEERKNFQTQQQYANQQIAQMQQRLAQMEDEAAPDDFTRLQKQLQRVEAEKQQYAVAYQQATRAQQIEQEKLEALQELADDFGLSVDDLKSANDYKQAAKLAAKLQLEREKAKQTDDDDRRTRNRVDLGNGAPRTPTSKEDAEWEELVRTRNTTGQMRWLREHQGNQPRK